MEKVKGKILIEGLPRHCECCRYDTHGGSRAGKKVLHFLPRRPPQSPGEGVCCGGSVLTAGFVLCWGGLRLSPPENSHSFGSVRMIAKEELALIPQSLIPDV